MPVALVTGTSTGIGFATSIRLARQGYRVFAGMRNLGKAEAPACRGHGRGRAADRGDRGLDVASDRASVQPERL